jgi:hypothetical protein
MKSLVETSRLKTSWKCLKTMSSKLHVDKWEMHKKKVDLKEFEESFTSMFG